MTDPDREKAVRIAKSILDGSTPVFLGCKQLFGPLCRLDAQHDKPFDLISGIESELDESPVWPSERAMWNAEALAREDAKLAAWLPNVRPQILEACKEVVRRFGGGD